MKAREITRPILDRKKLRDKSYGPEYSPMFSKENIARGPVKGLRVDFKKSVEVVFGCFWAIVGFLPDMKTDIILESTVSKTLEKLAKLFTKLNTKMVAQK